MQRKFLARLFILTTPLGVNEFISTELHEQWRFSSFYKQSDELRTYKEFD
jgi:hypothetical protein